MWLQSLKHHFSTKRKQADERSSPSPGCDEEGDLIAPPSVEADAEEQEYNSRPKRRSVSIDVGGPRPEMRSVPTPSNACGSERRTSLEQWHEARRARNSLEGQGTTTTDRLTICKAGTTAIINATYITIKHLGSGTFGKVMLCFNVYDQRLYAIKLCRKSQFAQSATRYSSRLRRSAGSSSHTNLQSPSSSSCFATARSAGGPSGPGLPPFATASCAAGSSQTQVAISATSGSVDPAAGAVAAAAAAAMLGGGFGAPAAGAFGQRPSSFTAGMPPPSPWPAQQLASADAAQQHHHHQQQQNHHHHHHQHPVRGSSAGLLAAPGPFGAPQLQQQLPVPPPGGQLLPPAGPSGLGAAGRAASWGGSFSATRLPPPQQQQLAQPQQHQPGAGAAGPAQPQHLLSSGSAGWGGAGLGTDCSTGSMSGGSVFQDALLRFQTEELVKEIAILKKLNHPNIVNLVEVIDDPTTDSLLLVMEYVEGGTLEPRRVGANHWEPLAEKDVWRHVREVLQGLDYLHTHRVVHGDLKPANLLLDSNSAKVKIADFGSSIMAGSDKMFSMRNCPGFSTPAFRSPESLTSGYQPSFEMDMWALGVCIYMWIFGCLPFTGVAPFIIYEKIRMQDVGMPSAPDVSPELKDFVSRLLDKDVCKRLDVLGAMAHPWVTLGGSAPLPSARCPPPDAALGAGAAGQQAVAAQAAAADGNGLWGGVEVSQADIESAIRQIGASTSELMDVVFDELHLKPGQHLIQPGDAADRIYLIATGELEILQPVGASGGCAGGEPLISGLEPGELAEGGDADLWDTSHVADLAKDPGTTAMLLNDVLEPWDSSSSQQLVSGVKLLAVKGPGDSIGVPLMPPGSRPGSARASLGSNPGSGRASLGANPLALGGGRERRWKVGVRARGAVTLFRARLEDLSKLVEAHPEMAGAVKQIVTQQETDMLVAEAMRQLRLHYSDSHKAGPPPATGGAQPPLQQQAAGAAAAAGLSPLSPAAAEAVMAGS